MVVGDVSNAGGGDGGAVSEEGGGVEFLVGIEVEEMGWSIF